MKKINYFLSLLCFCTMLSCASDSSSKVDEAAAKVTAAEKVAAEKAKVASERMDALQKLKVENRIKYDKIVTGFQSPESVATDGTFFYVSNVGAKLAPSAKDADGFISKLDAEGEVLELKWIAGEDLHAPKGMAIVKGVLYVADVDKIRGYKIKNKEKVFELDFSKELTLYLNDLAIKDDNTLFVSATDVGFIYEVNLKGKGSYKMVDIYSDLTGVNGLEYDKAKNRLMINSFGIDGAPYGMVGVCPLEGDKLKQKTIGTFRGFLDGIHQVADDMVLVSDWQDFEKGGNLTFYDLVTEEVRPILHGLIGGPADFYYDKKTKNVWLPAMQDNELIITKLDLDLERKDQGTIINSTGGYQVTTKDKIEFKPAEEKK
ncbi:MAG: hypothetical protein ACI8YQ_004797 [Polaribacter sp.]|jgi:hypothetical protein